ncbi:hypothetical protein, partial [Methylobacterium sp. J-077]|uniref:hypothetical protein n=1 Tax=Methylobacterium sp. J-077 TaxID=2836656 RepID=UPI001FB8E645
MVGIVQPPAWGHPGIVLSVCNESGPGATTVSASANYRPKADRRETTHLRRSGEWFAAAVAGRKRNGWFG